MTTLIIGILIGWLIPRPRVIGRIESAIWTPIIAKLLKALQNILGKEREI